MKKALIKIKVTLDENNIPDQITWNAEDGGIENEQTNAILVYVWDKKNSEALCLDLWTKEMSIDDMKQFFYQIFVSLSNTYLRSIGEENISSFIKNFAESFAKNSGFKT